MELKKAIEVLNKLEFEDYEYTYNGLYHNIDTILIKQAFDTVLEELNNRISKEILEEYLTQAEERYKTYKEASKENEGCKGGMWQYLGQVDILKRILGKSINVVTLDKE